MTNDDENDTIDSGGKNIMFDSKKAAKILDKQQPVSQDIITRVKNKLAEKAVILDQSEEWDRFLMQRGAEAVTLAPGDVIIMHTKVSASGFYEELIHYGQLKRGTVNTESKRDIIQKEIEAQEKLIKYQKAYKITDYEIEVLKNNLEHYRIKLEIIINGGI